MGISIVFECRPWWKNKEKLDDWINNKSNPTISQLRRISKKLKFPFGYFFLSEVPKENLELLNFRTVNNYEISNPSRDLIDVINHIESKQVWLSETRRNQGFERNIFNGGFIKNGSKKNFQQVAEDILKMLDLKINGTYSSAIAKALNSSTFNLRLVLFIT